MLIADADKLKKHFETVVDVHLFTVPQILTIIDTFSIDIPDGTKMILPRGEAKDVVYTNLARIMSFNSTDSKKHESEVHKDD